MIKYGNNDIGKIYYGQNSIGKAFYGSNLVYVKGSQPGPTPPTPTTPFTDLAYFDTNGQNYILTSIQFESGHSYSIVLDMRFLVSASGKGSGWNAGGAVTQRSANYSDGSNNNLSPVLSYDKRAVVSIMIKTDGETVVSALYNGVTSTHTRANTSLGTYAGQTGYPIGCMTDSGGTVPLDGTSIRVFSCKISRDDVVVFNGSPKIADESVENDRGQTVSAGTVGLYDTVSQKFYTNRGGGTDFTPGYNS